MYTEIENQTQAKTNYKSIIMMNLPRQLVDFKKYNSELKYPACNLDCFFESVKPIKKMVSHYYFVYHYCPKTSLYHMSLVIKIKNNVYFDSNKIPDFTKKLWNFNSNDDGKESIQKFVPFEIIKTIINPDDIVFFHINGSSKCYFK